MAYPYLPFLGDERFPRSGCDVLGIQRSYLDPVIATPFENGMVQTRPRFPRVRRSFVIPFKYVPPDKRAILDDFIRNTVVGSSGIFIWVDPATSEEIPVRFAASKVPQINEAGFVGKVLTYSFNLELEEV